MKLIGSLTSPFVRKVRVVLAEKRLDCNFVLQDPGASDNTISESNPLGKIPCLVLGDRDAVFDSRVIVEYLDTLSPVGRLIPATGRERVEVRTWEALADGTQDAAILMRYEQVWPGREATERSPAWIAHQQAKVDRALLAMSQGLGERSWCAGNQFSLADIAMGTALDYLRFRFPAIHWAEDYPNLARHHARMMQRPSFVDTAPPQA